MAGVSRSAFRESDWSFETIPDECFPSQKNAKTNQMAKNNSCLKIPNPKNYFCSFSHNTLML